MDRLLTRVASGCPAAILVLALSTGASAGDAKAGRAVFAAQCSTCHSDARNGPVMSYPGLKNPTQLDDLIAYLSTLK